MIAVIDYGAGNLRNVCKALEHVGATWLLSDDADRIRAADKVVLPGVGAFADCLAGLRSRGLFNPVRELAHAGTPLLGICVGMQLLFELGEEMGSWPGLGLLRGRVVRFGFDASGPLAHLKVPHIGWNEIRPVRPDPITAGMPGHGSYAYFVHSYHARVEDPSDVIAVTDYGYDFPSVVGRDNVWGIQFHPEKSQDVGLRMLRNFAEL